MKNNKIKLMLKKYQKGFNFIETILVLTIIMLLILALYFYYNKTEIKYKAALQSTYLSLLHSNLQEYFITHYSFDQNPHSSTGYTVANLPDIHAGGPNRPLEPGKLRTHKIIPEGMTNPDDINDTTFYHTFKDEVEIGSPKSPLPSIDILRSTYQIELKNLSRDACIYLLTDPQTNHFVDKMGTPNGVAPIWDYSLILGTLGTGKIQNVSNNPNREIKDFKDQCNSDNNSVFYLGYIKNDRPDIPVPKDVFVRPINPHEMIATHTNIHATTGTVTCLPGATYANGYCSCNVGLEFNGVECIPFATASLNSNRLDVNGNRITEYFCPINQGWNGTSCADLPVPTGLDVNLRRVDVTGTNNSRYSRTNSGGIYANTDIINKTLRNPGPGTPSPTRNPTTGDLLSLGSALQGVSHVVPQNSFNYDLNSQFKKLATSNGAITSVSIGQALTSGNTSGTGVRLNPSVAIMPEREIINITTTNPSQGDYGLSTLCGPDTISDGKFANCTKSANETNGSQKIGSESVTGYNLSKLVVCRADLGFKLGAGNRCVPICDPVNVTVGGVSSSIYTSTFDPSTNRCVDICRSKTSNGMGSNIWVGGCFNTAINACDINLTTCH